MTHTEDLKEYANALELDFIGFCSKDVFDGAPEEKRPDLYLKEVFSIISIEAGGWIRRDATNTCLRPSRASDAAFA